MPRRSAATPRHLYRSTQAVIDPAEDVRAKLAGMTDQVQDQGQRMSQRHDSFASRVILHDAAASPSTRRGVEFFAAAPPHHGAQVGNTRASRGQRSVSVRDPVGSEDSTATITFAAAEAASPVDLPAGLTWREVEVVRLAARGFSNREIGQALSISPRTAGHHLTHVYDKTGRRSRVGIAVFAMEHGLLQ